LAQVLAARERAQALPVSGGLAGAIVVSNPFGAMDPPTEQFVYRARDILRHFNAAARNLLSNRSTPPAH
jgi:hypothetical protein